MSKKDIAVQAGISTLKGAIGAIPFVGTAINEYAFEARSRIKQERVNKFINSFAEYIGTFKEEDLKTDQIKNEDFGDFFEQLIINVSKTRSEVKKTALRNLLTNQLLKPKDIDYTELLLEVTNSLQEKQIPILQGLNAVLYSSYIEQKGTLIKKESELNTIEEQLNVQYRKLDSIDDAIYVDEIRNLDDEKKRIKKEIQKLSDYISDMGEAWDHNTYKLQRYEFDFLIQDLCNKGLLIDNGMKYGAEPYELVEISQLGIDLIQSLTAP